MREIHPSTGSPTAGLALPGPISTNFAQVSALRFSPTAKGDAIAAPADQEPPSAPQRSIFSTPPDFREKTV
jgi:hypothetical protein